jgi:hypothetical protein
MSHIARSLAIAVLLLVTTAASAHAQAQNDHLKCYKVKDALKLAAVVDLNSPQFGLEAGCKVSKAKFFCVPATKTVISAVDKATGLPITPLPVSGPDAGDRICYKVKCPIVVPIPDQQVTDQFGTRTITKFKASYLCTPAVKGATYCGDGIANGSEECDGTSFANPAVCGGGCQADCRCRFFDNGDGTVTDNQTGLQWEQKDTAFGSGVNLADPHDVDNEYTWSNSSGPPDGPAFTDFLGNLNNCTSTNGTAVTNGGFAGHCDWRLPTSQELDTIHDMTQGFCNGGPLGQPCIDPIFGPTAWHRYWSDTTQDGQPANAWGEYFGTCCYTNSQKINPNYVRAVRTGP